MMNSTCSRALRGLAVLAASVLPSFAGTVFYIQQNLVSDIPGMAPVTDPNLVNPWGLSASATSPLWVSDNKQGVSSLYNGNTGTPLALVVTIPPPSGATPPSAPTGQVFNSTTSDFQVTGGKANFIFDTEDGTISGWRSGTSAILEVDNSASGAVYKGLALGSAGGANFLYAANFNSGNIDVFNGNFAPATFPGGFTDPTLPAGYAPFNIQNIGGLLYVTYAKQDADKHDDVSGAGNGYIDIFDTSGNFIRRLDSNGALNSPWGLALAPSNFGTFSGDLLVGNFGDGTINAFDPLVPGQFLGTLTDSHGNPITIEGLWGLRFGNGGGAGPSSSLFFSAGIPGGGSVEDHGLLGAITASPETGTIWIMAGGMAAIFLVRRMKRGRVPRFED